MVKLLSWGDLEDERREVGVRSEIKELEDRLGEKTYNYLKGTSALYRFIDTFLLLELVEASETAKAKLYDWQSVLMPMCLGIEEVLLKLASELGLKVGKLTVGQVYDKKVISQVLERIPDNKVRIVAEEQLNTLTGFIQEYRNNPMHGNKRVKSASQIKDKIGAQLHRLVSLIELLDGVALITTRKLPVIGGDAGWGASR